MDKDEIKSPDNKPQNTQSWKEEVFYQVFQSNPTPMAISRFEDAKYIDVNKAAEKTEKNSRDKVIGKKLLDIFPTAKEFGIFDALKKVYKGGIPVELPVTLYKDDRISGYRNNFVYKLPSKEIVTIYNNVADQERS